MYINQKKNLNAYVNRIEQYIQLTKPRIVVLLALTGIVAFLVPQNVIAPGFLDVLLYTLCGYFAAGGAMAVNNAIDIDIDRKMERTMNRPSIDQLSPRHVTIFGSVLMLLGYVISFLVFGPYTTIFLAWGSLFYIFGYSLLLKRNTVFNTILGGLASPAPVWGAFAARYEIAGISPSQSFLGVPLEGWYLGFLVLLWTPTHTWAMAAKNYHDYVNADIPMLPVQIGLRKTALITLLGSIIVMSYAIWILLILQTTIRAWIGVWLCIPFLLSSILFAIRPTTDNGRINFHAHNLWLAAIFVILL